MSRIRKKHLGVIPGVLALLALVVAWMVPFMPASADDGRSATASSSCVEGQPVLHIVLSGYPEVTPSTEVNNVNVTVDGEFKPAYSGGFTGPGTYEDFVPLGDSTISHSWKVEVDAYDGDHGDTTLTGSSEPCTSPDGDGDGVPDITDQCPGTPAGDVADANGCSDSQKDSDSDGVNDAVDQCPNQAGPASNGGCPVEEPPADSDGDGVNDENDQCAGTPSGEPVDANGCSDSQKDSDSDGVNDADDQCPGTPPGTDVDADGCAIEEPPADSDGDGVNDNKDECPGTPPGTEVDNKGCPIDVEDPSDAVKNNPDYWETIYPGSTCVKYDNVNAKTFTVPAPPEGTEYVAAIVKAGSRHSLGGNDPNEVDETVEEGDVLTHSSGKNISHVILCYQKTETPDEPEGKSSFDVSCEQLVINEPEGVKPEDSEYQYFLDGETIETGSHELAPGDYTLTLEVDGEQVDSDTFTVEECDNPPAEEPNTYSATSTCDRFDPEDPDQLSNGTISATVNNTDDETDAALEGYTAEVYFNTGDGQMLAFEPMAFGSVADGQSGTVTFEHANGGATYIVKILDGDKIVFEKTLNVEFCDTPPPGVDYDYAVSPNQGSCKVRIPKADVTTEFASSIGYQLKGENEVVWQHREVSAGDYVVTLPKVGKGDSVVYRVVIQPLDDTADRLTSKMFRFSVPSNCGGGDTPDQPDTPDNPDTPDQPDTPEYGVPETGATLTGSGSNGNGWPLMLFGAGGLVALALTRWGRKIKVMSR